jgi:antitoxin HicB
MRQYVYAFHLEEDGGETFFSFPSIPEIVSAIPNAQFERLSPREVQAHAEDAVLTALQGCIASRDDLPEADDPRFVSADGFVHLRPLEAMKLELFKVYRANCRSISDFSRRVGKQDTAVRRLLNLRHPSKTTEVDEALASFNKRLVHSWDVQSNDDALGRRLQMMATG